MKPEELADELEAAEDFLNDPNKFAISRRLRDRILAALRRVEKLEAALEPFGSSHVADNVDDDGWTSNIHREGISTWFGPSDFRAARQALAGEA